jgi:hypothetical protein
MVGHEMKSLPQRTSKKPLGDAAHLAEPQQEGFLKPRITRREIAFGAAGGRTSMPRDRYRRR